MVSCRKQATGAYLNLPYITYTTDLLTSSRRKRSSLLTQTCQTFPGSATHRVYLKLFFASLRGRSQRLAWERPSFGIRADVKWFGSSWSKDGVSEPSEETAHILPACTPCSSLVMLKLITLCLSGLQDFSFASVHFHSQNTFPGPSVEDSGGKLLLLSSY